VEWVDPFRLRRDVSLLFQHAGLARRASDTVASALVDADVAGVASHGVMLCSLYLQRMGAGSVTTLREGEIVSDSGSALVMDARNMLGQLSASQAVDILKARAPQHGIAAVSVRNAFHFGAAGYWASQLADAGLIGIAMSNTRPLMPAPGGARPVVGNNPLAIAMPSSDGVPLVVDMALSASAMGKIRLAESAGRPIPEGWAADANGRPTTDAAQAIAGMLLPAAGPKGFGLAFMVELFCGGLSSGAMGAQVQRLYGDKALPYGCAHFFMAIDVGHFVAPETFAARAHVLAQAVRGSARAHGTEKLYTPGQRAWDTRRQHINRCPVQAATMRQLRGLADGVGIKSSTIFKAL
jgi:LDH2 family malate/lactate/ureidoglycolate dehydrogenase